MNDTDAIDYPAGLEMHTFQIFKAAAVPMMLYRVDGTVENINTAFINFLGFELEEIHIKDFILFHQDEFLLDEDALKILSDNPDNPVVIDKKCTNSHGEIISFRVTIFPQMDNRKAVIRYISLLEDLSKQSKTRDELQLASMVSANSSEGIMVTDENGFILDVNSSFSKITGYSKEEVCGKNASILSSGQQDKLFYKLMWRSIRNTGQWKGEIWNKRKNGDTFPVSISIHTDYNQSGKVNKRVALFSDQSLIKDKEKQIFKQAYYDSITALPNRDLFMERLHHIINLTRSKTNCIALMLLDIDGFKEINDTLGHEVGDEILKLTADRLLRCIDKGDVVARLGGDEFTIIVDDISKVEQKAKSILGKLSKPYFLHEQQIFITGSIGVTIFPQDSDDVSGLLRNADQAMYSVKKRGRNGFSFFTLSMQQEAQQRLQSINDLRQAIVNHQFILHFQPIVDLKTNEVYKAEALLRWNHPEKGLIYPDEFIAIAEDSGLIIDIGKWVVKEALQQTYMWRETYREDFQLSVNESPLQFKSEDYTLLDWIEYLQKLNLPGDAICIEITENLLMDFSETVDKKIQQFRDASIQISLDDFGTGYASLSYLKRFEIEYLKIDKSYVQSMLHKKEDLVLCETIIQMAHKLGILVIAEGIETEQQLATLKSLGCNYGQGYFFSRPVSVDKFDAYLKQQRTGI